MYTIKIGGNHYTFLLSKEHCDFNTFTVMSNVVEHPRNKLVPIFTYAIAAVNMKPFPHQPFFSCYKKLSHSANFLSRSTLFVDIFTQL